MTARHDNPQSLLVVMPSWVGDAAMATPTLRALHEAFGGARITALVRPYVRPVIDALPWVDRVLSDRRAGPHLGRSGARRRSMVGLAARLRAGRFDVAVLLPNSFRSAALVRLAGIGRRVGYARDGRGPLLTDRLAVPMASGRPDPISAVDYYLAIARHLGADTANRRLALATRPADDRAADAMLASAGVDFSGGPVVVLNPGAATKGAAKCWPVDRYAALAERLAADHGVQVLVNGGPAERTILDALCAGSGCGAISLLDVGGTLRLFKSVLKRTDLVISNDTGARHIAAGMGVPLVSLFGPTDPRWAELDGPHETVLVALDAGGGTRPMTGIGVDEVYAAAVERLAARAEPAP